MLNPFVRLVTTGTECVKYVDSEVWIERALGTGEPRGWSASARIEQ